MMKRLLIGLSVLGSAALAWSPNPDQALVNRVVDSAYNRTGVVNTSLTLELAVKDKKFVDPVDVKVLRSDVPAVCMDNWLASPTAFTQYGSRPISITLTGLADLITLEAQKARNSFRRADPVAALRAAQAVLPSGHLRIFVEIVGLETADLRAAYTVGLVGSGPDDFILPYRSNFLNDWRNEGGRFRGTMVYYFDLTQTKIDPKGKVSIALKGEFNDDCAYAFTADLSKFE